LHWLELPSYILHARKGREKPSGGEELIQAPAPPIMLAVVFAAAIAEIGSGE
jgi:hypothetical protein